MGASPWASARAGSVEAGGIRVGRAAGHEASSLGAVCKRCRHHRAKFSKAEAATLTGSGGP